MAESQTKDYPKDPESSGSLEELREIILGPAQGQLNEIRERLDDPETHAREISAVLAEAIMIRTASDTKLAKSLKPTIEDAIRTSISKNRRVFVDILFPLMGPAIRRAIASTIRGMIQSFNRILEDSFSIQGLKWRFEALRTKKQFAEVVLLHTLVYQIEQVFLIHRETGLLLQHMEAKGMVVQDPELVSGMLTAIQDFVRDSFGKKEHEGLDDLRVGERSVWIEYRTNAIMAVVIQGNPPEDYHTTLREVLDDIHLKFSDAFETFDGDTVAFEASRDLLTDCFQSEYKADESKTSPLLWSIAAFCLAIAGIFLFNLFENHRQWVALKERLNNQPGVLVTQTEKKSGKYYIAGLRDPMAEDPLMILESTDINPENVIFRWEQFHSLDPEFMMKRIRTLLNPPDKVTLALHDGGLEVSGDASHRWIMRYRDLAPTLSGLSYIRDHLLIDLDERELKETKHRIETVSLFFDSSYTLLSPDQEETLEEIAADIRRLLTLTDVFGKKVYLEIIGHADPTGPSLKNIQVSKERAENVLAALVSRGLPADLFSAIGAGEVEIPGEEETVSEGRQYRFVNFRITDSG